MITQKVRATKKNIKILIDVIEPKMTEKQKTDFIRDHLEMDYTENELLFVSDWQEEFGSDEEYAEE
jgi:hypothetical protein